MNAASKRLAASQPLATWLGKDMRRWVYAIKVFGAAMLALYIALALGLSRPYWAVATVYLVSSPLTGATRSKGLYRVAGTLLGAAAAVGMVPTLVNEPVVLMAAISLWAGAMLYLSLLEPSPRSYVFLLAAYTLPIVALPAVSDPASIFDVALLRVEEIVIGIVCASMVSALILPSNIAPELEERFAGWVAQAQAWTTGIPMDRIDSHTRIERHRKLTAELHTIRTLMAQAAHESGNKRTLARGAALQMRLQEMLQALEAHGMADPAAANAPYAPRDAATPSIPAALRDHRRMLVQSASAATATFLAGALWMLSGWIDGAGAVSLAALTACFVSTLDVPRHAVRRVLLSSVACLLLACFYQFVVLPNAIDFLSLVCLFAIPYLCIGFLMTRPDFGITGVLLAVTTASFANVQQIYEANFADLFNTSLAASAGILFAAAWVVIARPLGNNGAPKAGRRGMGTASVARPTAAARVQAKTPTVREASHADE